MGLFSHFEEREKEREREKRKREKEVRGVNSSPFIETNIRSTVAMCISYFFF